MKINASDIQDIIRRNAPEIRKLSDFVHANPEVGFDEVKAAAKQTSFLRKNGFIVGAGIDDLPTAFKASYGNEEPTVAILSEYDALPETGHACGHNLIMSAALAAGVAVKEYLFAHPEVSGSVCVIGTPAEESKGGKVLMLEKHAFDGVDFVFSSHPFPDTLPDQGALAVARFTVRFRGHAAHAASAPHLGRNALDAILLLFNGINCWRQQLPDSARVHGVITSGGNVPNIIPDYTEAYFYLRGIDVATQDKLERRFVEMVKGAALMTETKYEIEKQDTPYLPIKINAPLNAFFIENSSAFGLYPEKNNPHGMISTDVGNVSQRIPATNWFFKINDDGAALHTEAFKQAATTDYAFEQAMNVAAIIAAGTLELFLNADFRHDVTADFQHS